MARRPTGPADLLRASILSSWVEFRHAAYLRMDHAERTGKTQQEAADILGVSRSSYLRLRAMLPEIDDEAYPGDPHEHIAHVMGEDFAERAKEQISENSPRPSGSVSYELVTRDGVSLLDRLKDRDQDRPDSSSDCDQDLGPNG